MGCKHFTGLNPIHRFIHHRATILYHRTPQVKECCLSLVRSRVRYEFSWCQSSFFFWIEPKSVISPQSSGPKMFGWLTQFRQASSSPFDQRKPGRSRKFYWLPCVGIRTAALYESLYWADLLRFFFPASGSCVKPRQFRVISSIAWAVEVKTPNCSKRSWAWVGGIISFFFYFY